MASRQTHLYQSRVVYATELSFRGIWILHQGEQMKCNFPPYGSGVTRPCHVPRLRVKTARAPGQQTTLTSSSSGVVQRSVKPVLTKISGCVHEFSISPQDVPCRSFPLFSPSSGSSVCLFCRRCPGFCTSQSTYIQHCSAKLPRNKLRAEFYGRVL